MATTTTIRRRRTTTTSVVQYYFYQSSCGMAHGVEITIECVREIVETDAFGGTTTIGIVGCHEQQQQQQ